MPPETNFGAVKKEKGSGLPYSNDPLKKLKRKYKDIEADTISKFI